VKYEAVSMFCICYVRCILSVGAYVLIRNKLITIMKINRTYNNFEKLLYKIYYFVKLNFKKLEPLNLKKTDFFVM